MITILGDLHLHLGNLTAHFHQNQNQQLREIIMSAKSEILAAIAAEKEQLRVSLEQLIAAEAAKRGLSDEDKNEIIAGIGGIFTPADAPPLKGVRLETGFRAEGAEVVQGSVLYLDTPQATADLVKSRVSALVAAAIAAAVPLGKPVAFHFSHKVNGEDLAPVSGEDLGGLLAAQKAWLEGMLGIVNDQIAGAL